MYIHQYFCLPSGKDGIRSYKNAIALYKAGFEVTILCINNGRNSLKNTLNKNLKKSTKKNVFFFQGLKIVQLDIDYSNYMGLFKRSIVFLKFAFISTFYSLFNKFDVVFATSTPLTVAIPGIFSKILLRRKFVFEVRDSWPELPYQMGLLPNKFVYYSLLILEKLAYVSSDFCIGLAPGICEIIESKGINKSKIINIPNSCDIDIFQPLEQEKIKNPQLINDYFSSNDFVAAFTGAHGIANGLESVLDVAMILKKRKVNHIKFLFIGDGKVKEKLKHIKMKNNLSNCFFMEPIKKEKLASILKNSVHVGMMVLKNIEAFYNGTSPNKFFDYIASGLPVINNYPGWIANIIYENQIGICVQPNEPDQFADALIKISENKELKLQMSINAEKLAQTTFSRDRMTEQITNIFIKIFNNS